MKILIADDEQLVRASLRSMLEEIDLPLKIIGEASNGEETLEWLRESQPDLVFIDIRMPKMNGLEAIKRGQAISPHTQWVILSGFSEFHYAREALQLGAADYLLKPVSPEELEQSLQKWIKANQKFHVDLHSYFENQIISLYYGLSPIHDDTDQAVFTEATFQCCVFFIDSHLDEKSKAERLLNFSRSLRKEIQNIRTSGSRLALFALPSGELMTIGACGGVRKTSFHRYFDQIGALLQQHSDPDFSITAIQGEECMSFEALQQQVSQIIKLSYVRPLVGIKRKWNLTQLFPYQADAKMIEFSRLLLQLSDCCKEGIYLNYMKTIDDLEKMHFYSALPNQTKEHIHLFLSSSIHTSLKVDDHEANWIKGLQKHGEKWLKEGQKQDNRQSDLIDQVLRYIDKHYMNDIGIGEIAENLKVTPNYLSTLFHKKTGITFTKYITRTRIHKAKELLLDPNILVQQAAEKVGYYSTRHFTKLFRELVGCYPSEFRDQSKAGTADADKS